MRIFADFTEAASELARELNEMGEKRGDRLSLYNYDYSVMKPDYTEVPRVHETYVEAEWRDRVIGGLNPGRAWRQRKDIWEPKLEIDRGGVKAKVLRYSYTMSDRVGGRYIQDLIADIQSYPEGDDLFLGVWHDIDNRRRGKRRVPTEVGFWFKVHKGSLWMTMVSREEDFIIHYPNDVALAIMLQWYVAQKTDLKVGAFTHFIFQLWADREELGHVF